jgi:hypothetical protein
LIAAITFPFSQGTWVEVTVEHEHGADLGDPGAPTMDEHEHGADLGDPGAPTMDEQEHGADEYR